MLNPIFDNIPNIKNSSSPPIHAIDTNRLNDKTFKKNFIHKNKPCIIKNATSHWPALKKWKSENYLESNCKSYETYFYPHMNINKWDNMKEGEKKASLSDIIKRLRKDVDDEEILSAPYINILENGPLSKLYKDIGDFNFLSSPPHPIGYPLYRCFMYKGASTGWHRHHVDETLMCQIIGSKTVALLPDDTVTDTIVSKELEEDLYLNSKSLINHKDAKKLQPVIVEVNPGDALYIPPFWWHAVIPNDTEFGITLAHCWRSPFQKMGNLSFPAVRNIWKKAICKPSANSFKAITIGTFSLGARAVFRICQVFK